MANRYTAITKKDGTVIEAYVFDRREGATLAQCAVRILPKDRPEKVTITYDEISGTIILAESVLQPEYNECGEI